MGINFSYAALLARARENHVSFNEILTIGHLNLYISPDQLRRLAERFRVVLDPAAVASDEYADRFFREFLQVGRVKALDYSNYEGCDIVHDLNYPIDNALHERFDAVIDGGSLEHVFHFPVAIANCMNMVKVGGSVFLFTMANNHAGHGFYQFSPELFFRVFQPDNGFEIRDVILETHQFPGGELSRRTKCFSVVDPAVAKTRVGLVSKSPVMMMVHAVKRESKTPFASFPIQSDYASRFGGESEGSTPDKGVTGLLKSIARPCFRWLPERCRNYITGQRQLRNYSFSNRRFYNRWDPV